MPSPDYDVGPRFGLRALKGDSLISDIDAGFFALRDDVESKMLGVSSGLDSALPTAGVFGRIFRATDTGRILFDNGTIWESLNLALKLTSVNLTAKNGQWVVVQASGVTVTLPAVQAGAMVRVTNINGTAASPTSVAGAGGAQIYGQGTAPAASIVLGRAYSGVMLVCDGTNWAIVAGQQDTGWVTLSLNSGWNAVAGNYVPAVRLLGDEVLLRGVVAVTSSANPITTLASQFRPAALVQINTSDFSVVRIVQITTAGVMTSSGAVALDGLSYALV